MSRSNIYIFLLFIFGIVYIVITPPFQVPDAPAHFFRAHQISQGDFISEKRDERTGGMLPSNLLTLRDLFAGISYYPENIASVSGNIAAFDIEIDADNKEFIGFENTAVFSPVPYIPAAIAIAASGLITDSALVTYYAAAISTMIISLLILKLAMELLPQYRLLIFAFCLTPIFIFELASFSSDSLSNSLSVLFICQIFLGVSRTKDINTSYLIQLLVTGVLLALCKQTYSVLFMLTALITPQYFKNAFGYFKYQTIYCGTLLIAILSWQLVVSNIYSPLPWVRGADAALQLQNVFEHPIGFFQVIWADLIRNHYNYLLQMGGAVLGWVDTLLPFTLIWIHMVTLMFLAYILNVNLKFSPWQYMMALLTIVVGVIVVELALYLHAQPFGASRIEGIHGRYFLHLAFLLLMIISALPKFVQSTILERGCIAICITPYFVSIPIMITRYYG